MLRSQKQPYNIAESETTLKILFGAI